MDLAAKGCHREEAVFPSSNPGVACRRRRQRCSENPGARSEVATSDAAAVEVSLVDVGLFGAGLALAAFDVRPPVVGSEPSGFGVGWVSA